MMTKARTITNYWLLALMPENSMWMNTQDARALGVQMATGSRLISASNPDGAWDLHDGTQKPMIGMLKVLKGMRPGVVSFALGFGHWASGARDIVIDGATIPGDPRRQAGFHANAAMRVDPHLGT
jgi:tetrathionate reductase subunit A